MRGARGVVVCGVLCVIALAPASADDAPPATAPSAPTPAPSPTTEAPAPVPSAPPAPGSPTATTIAPAPPPSPATSPSITRSLTEHTVDRAGPLFLAGISSNGDSSGLRFDAIMPLPLEGAPQFRVGLTAVYGHDSASSPADGIAVDAYGLTFGPNAYYDWRLPVETSAGDLVASIEGGPELSLGWFKIDQPYMPGTYQRVSAYALRFAGALQFRFHGGLVLSLQPLGVAVPLTHPTLDSGSASNTMLTLTANTTWEGALLCGYQFR